ncbi:hypothetical protein OUZ56_015224 [Daphnia magna]|uniref:Uncharacterized protein n=1 Tax=Daphnia magna TaxID=35525 RepID=A0ABR0AM57_9CRUS|nr:hypothetical protein OUZ56_015224 [Daphnia magna]
MYVMLESEAAITTECKKALSCQFSFLVVVVVVEWTFFPSFLAVRDEIPIWKQRYAPRHVGHQLF